MAALNAGHRAADADILIRCDDDLEPAADDVEAQIRLHRDYGGVIGTLKNVYPDTPYSRVYGNFRDARFKEGALSVAEEGRWLYWNGNFLSLRSTFDRTGGYDLAYRLYGWEDVDMGKMVHDAGGRIIISDEVEVKHYAEATTTAVRALRALHWVLPAPSSCKARRCGAPCPEPDRSLGFLVKTLARFTTEKTIKALGDASDKILLKLPAKAAEKLVACRLRLHLRRYSLS